MDENDSLETKNMPLLERIEWFMEEQASLRCMIRLLARPLPPLPSATCLSFSVFLCGRAYCRERGVPGGRGAESYDRKKAWPSINHLILSWSPLTGRIGQGQRHFIYKANAICPVAGGEAAIMFWWLFICVSMTVYSLHTYSIIVIVRILESYQTT